MEKTCEICKISFGTVVSSFAFVVISFFTTGAFLMVTISPFFNHYYAGVFLILGGMFLLKFHRKKKVELEQTTPSKRGYGMGAGVLHEPFEMRKSRILNENQNQKLELAITRLEYLLAATIFAAGIVCTFLEKDWFQGIPYKLKILPYCLIGESISFTWVVCCLEFFEYTKFWFDWCRKDRPTQLIASNLMYFIVLVFSMTIGLVQGFLFGVADIEDMWSETKMFYELGKLEGYLILPISMYVGALCGCLFVLVRNDELNRARRESESKKNDGEEE